MLANVRIVSSDMAHRLATWIYGVDPGVERVFLVSSEHPDPAGLDEVSLVVVRSDLSEPRLLLRDESASSKTFPPNVWELPVAMLEHARGGSVTAPRGFEPGRWQLVPRPEQGSSPPRALRVDRLRLGNIRCIESLSIELQPGFNVLIGGNGAGKTTILDALAHVFGSIVSGMAKRLETDEEILSVDDVRLVAVERRDDNKTDEPRYPAKVDLTVSAYGESIDEYGWTVTRDGETKWQGPGKPISSLNVFDLVRWSVTMDHPTPLPVFAYYRTSRTSQTTAPSALAPRNGTSRWSGYVGWTHSNADLSRFEQWLERKELESYQRGEPLGVFDAVKEAVRRCLEPQGLHDFGFNATLGALAARRQGGPWIPFNRLSAGVRNMFGLVVDLAIRCALLNPQLGRDAAKETSGVVLVDELDLHLHPKWQRRVVGDLRQTFPEIQFISTTHSGLLVSSLRPEEITILDLDSSTGEVRVIDGHGEDEPKDPRLLTSSEIYDEYFDIDGFFAQELGEVLEDYRYWARNPARDDEHDAKVHEWKQQLDAAKIPTGVEIVPRRHKDVETGE